MFNGNTPEKGSKQWKANEKTINNNPVLKKARDAAEGLDSPRRKYSTTGAGKGSAERPINKAKFDEGWDRIFGKKEERNDD